MRSWGDMHCEFDELKKRVLFSMKMPRTCFLTPAQSWCSCWFSVSYIYPMWCWHHSRTTVDVFTFFLIEKWYLFIYLFIYFQGGAMKTQWLRQKAWLLSQRCYLWSWTAPIRLLIQPLSFSSMCNMSKPLATSQELHRQQEDRVPRAPCHSP